MNGYKFILLVMFTSLSMADGTLPEHFSCTMCRSFVSNLDQAASYEESCRHTEPFEFCSMLKEAGWNEHRARPVIEANAGDALTACRALHFCPLEERWERTMSRLHASPDVDLRVSAAYGSRGYNSVRISVLDNSAKNHSADFMKFFDYNAPFKYFWTEKTLHTAVKTAKGGLNQFVVDADLTLNITLPVMGSGVRAFLIADPCFSGLWVGCSHGDEWKIFDRLTTLLNTGLGSKKGGVDFWILIGDNFYDPTGVLGASFFKALTTETKSKPIVSAPGNHDFWQHGTPTSGGIHTYGNGYMQYYLMDNAHAAGDKSGAPLNFSVDPFRVPSGSNELAYLPVVDNFFYYSLLGDVAVLSYSGAHTHPDTMSRFSEFCNWVRNTKPKWVITMSHWSDVNMGCQAEMSAKLGYEYVITLPGCDDMKDRIKWLEGHDHCNVILRPDTGFRVAGYGMSGCANFGVSYLDTTAGSLEIGYFPIVGGNGTVPEGDESANAKDDITFDTLVQCIQSGGLGSCKHLANIWMNQTA